MSDIATRSLTLRSVGYADRVIEACSTLLRRTDSEDDWVLQVLLIGYRDEAQRDRAAALALLAGAGDKEQPDV